MIGRLEISEDLLHAFVDGELEQGQYSQLAEVIAQDPTLSQRIAAFRADKAMFAQVYGPLAERPLPADWVTQIERSVGSRRVPHSALWMALAAALVIGIVSLAYFRPVPTDSGESIIREAIAARNHKLAPRETLEAGTMAQMQAIDHAAASSLKMRLKAPDLSRMGYRLANARVYEGVPGGKAVELVYKGADHSNLTIYVRRPTSAVRFDQFKRDGLRICIWQDDVIGTVITGNISAAEMQRIASLAYTGLES